MAHLYILFHLTIVVVGLFSLGYSLNKCFMYRDSLILKYYALVTAMTNVKLLFDFVCFYFLINIPESSYAALKIILPINTTLCFVCFILLMVAFNAIYAAPYRKWINIFFYGIFVVVTVIIFSPYDIKLLQDYNRIELLSGYFVIEVIFFVLSTYTVLVPVIHIKKLTKKPERIFGIVSMLFAITHWVDNIIRVAPTFAKRYIVITEDVLGFYYTSIGFFVWSLFILYFLHKYYPQNIAVKEKVETVFNRNGEDIPHLFIEKYRITRREVDVLKLLTKGHDNSTISDQLFISLSTVKSHVYNIFQKTESKSRIQLLKTINEYQANCAEIINEAE